MNNNVQNTLSDSETATYIGMSESWLRQSRTKGVGKKAPPFLKLGRSVRYLRSDLDTWLFAQRKVNTLGTEVV